MNFQKNPIKVFWMELTVGGSDNAPPTSCPRTAYITAGSPAHAERTELPERGKKGGMGVVGQGMGKRSFLLQSAGL